VEVICEGVVFGLTAYGFCSERLLNGEGGIFVRAGRLWREAFGEYILEEVLLLDFFRITFPVLTLFLILGLFFEERRGLLNINVRTPVI